MRLHPLKQRPPLNVFRRNGCLIPPRRDPRTPAAVLHVLPAFRTHAQVDEFANEHHASLPEAWDGWTIAEKRAWLEG
jgi:hypothetical protein